MLDSVMHYICGANPLIIYMIILGIPFIENIFPPSPSDVIILITGTLVAQGTISLIPAISLASVGSEIGFLLLYYLGKQTDKVLLDSGKLRFINRDDLLTAEKWFTRFGFLLILFNRFVPGVRSIIAYFAGMSELPVTKTVLLSSISAILWHSMLILLGYFFGSHIDLIDTYLNLYGKIIIAFSLGMGVVFILRYYWRKKHA